MKFNDFINICVIFLILAVATACSRQIEGEIFLDRNANNIRDDGEGTLANVPFTLSHNEAILKTGKTDETGQYFIGMDQFDTDSEYCVRVNNQNLKLKKANSAITEPLKKTSATSTVLKLDINSATDSETETCTQDELGEPDCSDVNCCSEAACENESICEENEEETNDTEDDSQDCPSDVNGDPICSDSRCANESSCNNAKISVQSMETCGQPTQSTFVMSLDVPIAIDYRSRIQKIKPRILNDLRIGDNFYIDVFYPSSCNFQIFDLPEFFAPQELQQSYNSLTREINFAEALQETPLNRSREVKHSFPHDELFTYRLYLKVVDAKDQAFQLNLQPILTCPDGQEVKASGTTVKLLGKDN